MPVPDYLTYVKPFEDVGKDDAWITQALEGMSATDIAAVDLYDFLRDEELWRNTPGGLVGSLQTAWTNKDYPAEPTTTKTLEQIFGVAFDGLAEKLHTTLEYRPKNPTVPKGVQFGRSLYLALVRLEPTYVSTTQIDELYDLGGGRPFAGIVEADIVTSRAEYAADQAEQERVEGIIALRSEIDATWLSVFETDGTTDAATARAAIKAGL
jgi:hypothetical protein